MPDPHKPLSPADKKPDEALPEPPEPDQPRKELPEGQLPGMPVWRDPLLNPGPTPAQREIPPLD